MQGNIFSSCTKTGKELIVKPTSRTLPLSDFLYFTLSIVFKRTMMKLVHEI